MKNLSARLPKLWVLPRGEKVSLTKKVLTLRISVLAQGVSILMEQEQQTVDLLWRPQVYSYVPKTVTGAELAAEKQLYKHLES